MADAAGEDEALMREAMAAAMEVRGRTSPNPWVGCVIVPEGDGPVAIGATQTRGASTPRPSRWPWQVIRPKDRRCT